MTSAVVSRVEGLLDLAVVAVLAVVTPVALLWPEVPTPVEWVLGVPFLLVAPGYALVAALFPVAPGGDAANRSTERNPGWPVRAALSMVASVVVVGALGVLLSPSGSIQLRPVALSVGAVTIGFVVVAVARRTVLPAADRDARSGHSGRPLAALGANRTQAVATGVALVVLAATVAYAGATPPPDEPYTEFYLLEPGENGTLVADDYPTSFVAGANGSVHVGVENHEHEPMTYTVVVLAESVAPDGTVTARERLDRFVVRVSPGQRAVVQRLVTPTTVGDRVRVQFLLFEGDSPAEPRPEDADLRVRLWTQVTDDGDGGS